MDCVIMKNCSLEFSYDEDFVRNNLRFLLEDEIENWEKIQLNSEDKNLLYQSSKIKTELSLVWSPAICGSIISPKEIKSNFVNELLDNSSFNLEAIPNTESKTQDDDKDTDKFTIKEIASTSTPKKPIERLPLTDLNTNQQTPNEADKENVKPQQKLEFCKFCYKNGEPTKIYRSHVTKNFNGTPSCPILRKYKCDLCGGTGDRAHTRKYCPLNNHKGNKVLKPNSRRLSNGVSVTFHNHK